MSKITLRSISELLGMNFFIPSYQRGYRWDEKQIVDLLDDVYSFAIKRNKSPKEFYCLQPIVVKKRSWDKVNLNQTVSGWEVIDGQQRLTTIRILLAYLIKEHLLGKSLKDTYGKDTFTITYETRENSEEFLIDPSEPSNDYIDYYYISSAYKYIKDWFQKREKPYAVSIAILNTLLYKLGDEENLSKGVVQVIWYEIEDDAQNNSKAIDTFIRINMGKIPLTNSELIKALFLQERDFNKENEIATLKQLQIATEWDRIEKALQNEDFWWFLNKDENKTPARIDYIFNFMKDIATSNKPSLQSTIGTDLDSTFRYFESELSTTLMFKELCDQWELINQCYLTLEEWYNNPIWYHYIGFLITCGVSIFEISKIVRIDFRDNTKILTKNGITHSLMKRIQFHLAKVNVMSESDSFLLDMAYGARYDKLIKDVLLLYNIEHIVKHCKDETLIYRFPFKAYKESAWDVEHVDSFSTNKLISREARVQWLKFALEEIRSTEEYSGLKEEINEFINTSSTAIEWDYLRKEVIKICDENDNDEETKNSIGNLVLLDDRTNRGYGNALFSTKRKKIIEKDKFGVFIPICTKNVFLKYFHSNSQTNAKWTVDDMNLYNADIAATLKDFLTIKSEYENE